MNYNFNQNIEMLSYQEITKTILEDENRPMNTFEIFTIISKLLNFTESQFEKRIEDFFATLSTDKSFILLEDGFWDLKKKHITKIFIDDDNEEETEEDLDTEETNGEEVEDINYDEPTDDDAIITDDDDLDGLTTISEDDLEDEEN